MGDDVELSCRCGNVEGRLHGASPHTVNRVICYCDDCQAFLHQIGRADLLDGHGGTDIVQVAPASIRFDKGTERIACLRLTPKGLHRWYASCCKTPLGNTLTPSVPFVGIAPELFRLDASRRDDVFGKPRGAILAKYAIGTPPAQSKTRQLSFLAGTVRLIVGWRLGGKAWPHPFFDRETRAPKYPVTILSHDERESLRPLCGPRAA